MTNEEERSERMPGDVKTIRIATLDEFDRELSRDGGEWLEVPADFCEQYGIFAEDVGIEDEIFDAADDLFALWEVDDR